MTIASDLWICHARSVVNNLVDTENVYYYNLDIVNPSINVYFDVNGNCINRTCHVIDLLYLFTPSIGDDEALEMGHSMMDYWFNFAVNHDPNEGVNVSSTVWPEVSESENIFILDEELSTASISSDRADICAFFDSIGYVPPYKYPNVDGTAKEDDDGGLESGTIVLIVIGVLVG